MDKLKKENRGYGLAETLSNKLNYINTKDTIYYFIERLKDYEDFVKKTIGPFGQTAMRMYIPNHEERAVHVSFSRDGFENLSSIVVFDRIDKGFQTYMRPISYYMNRYVGDGTTTPIPILSNLYSNLIEKLTNYNTLDEKKSNISYRISPVSIKKILYSAMNILKKGILETKEGDKYKYIIPIDNLSSENRNSIIRKVASVAANNQRDIGDKVAELYINGQLDSNLKTIIANSPNTDGEDFIEVETRVMFDPMPLLPDFRTGDIRTGTFVKPIIAVLDFNVGNEHFNLLSKLMEYAHFVAKRPLLIIAQRFGSSDVVNFFKYSKIGLMYTDKNEVYNKNYKKVIRPLEDNDDYVGEPVTMEVGLIEGYNHKLNEEDDVSKFEEISVILGAYLFDYATASTLPVFKNDNECFDYIKRYLGEAEHVISNSETHFFSPKTDKVRASQIIKRLEDYKTKVYGEESVKITNSPLLGLIDRRIADLSGKSNIYYVGGKDSIEQDSRRLVVDDAISSVQTTITSKAVTLGGNISISNYIHLNLNKMIEDIYNELSGKTVELGNMFGGVTENVAKDIIKDILNCIEEGFGSTYRHALFNAQPNDEGFKEANDNWLECVKSNEFKVYNIMSNKMEELNLNSNLIVPVTTDIALLTCVIGNLAQLMETTQIITPYEPGFDDVSGTRKAANA